MLAALERHDGGGKGYLSREEFTAAAQDIFACVTCWVCLLRILRRNSRNLGAGTWLAA